MAPANTGPAQNSVSPQIFTRTQAPAIAANPATVASPVPGASPAATVNPALRASQVLAADPAPTEAQARFEADHLTDLIAHHQSAIAMTELAANRAERPELRGFAALVGRAHAKEIEILQGWLENWYGETPRVGNAVLLDRKVQRQIDALTELDGKEFDEAFLKAMSLHHADALLMARDALLGAYHSELIDFSRELSEALSDEIALMRGWLQEWHEVNEVTSRDRPDNRRWHAAGKVTVSASRIPAITPRPDGP